MSHIGKSCQELRYSIGLWRYTSTTTRTELRHYQYIHFTAPFLILTNYGIIIETGINGVYFTSEKKNKDFHFHSPILTEKSKLNGKFYQFALTPWQGHIIQVNLRATLIFMIYDLNLFTNISIFELFFSVNEKIYIFIWFWFLLLGVLSFLVILYRLTIIFSPYIRAYVIRLRFR